MQDSIEIDRADVRMLDDIINIQRKCFPLSIRENALARFRKRWFLYLLGLPSVEIYAILVNQKIVGSYVLIVDLVCFQKHMSKISAVEKFVYYIGDALTIILRPQLIRPLISKLISRIRTINKKSRYPQFFLNRKTDPAKMVWCESVAILPEYQGLGLGKRLHKFIIKRAIELGKKVLASRIDDTNKASITFFKRLGYAAVSQGGNGALTYKKFLD